MKALTPIVGVIVLILITIILACALYIVLDTFLPEMFKHDNPSENPTFIARTVYHRTGEMLNPYWFKHCCEYLGGGNYFCAEVDDTYWEGISGIDVKLCAKTLKYYIQIYETIEYYLPCEGTPEHCNDKMLKPFCKKIWNKNNLICCEHNNGGYCIEGFQCDEWNWEPLSDEEYICTGRNFAVTDCLNYKECGVGCDLNIICTHSTLTCNGTVEECNRRYGL